MKGGSPRPRGNSGWRKVIADVGKVDLLMREHCIVVSDGHPVEAIAHFDNRGRCRRIVARYGDGWKVTLRLHLDSTCSATSSLRLATQPKGRAA